MSSRLDSIWVNDYTNDIKVPLDEETKEEIKSLMLELINEPVDIFITNDLPSLLDMGDEAAKHFDYFRKQLKKKVEAL